MNELKTTLTVVVVLCYFVFNMGIVARLHEECVYDGQNRGRKYLIWFLFGVPLLTWGVFLIFFEWIKEEIIDNF